MLKKETSTEVVNKMTELRFGMQHERMANANIVTRGTGVVRLP